MSGSHAMRGSTAVIHEASKSKRWFLLACAAAVTGRLFVNLPFHHQLRNRPRPSKISCKSTSASNGLTVQSLAASTDFRVTDDIIDLLSDQAVFGKLAVFEENLLIQRDDEDAEMLKAGIQTGIDQ
ncbi:unnamed protein product, partial [Symbiodinium pilosum]